MSPRRPEGAVSADPSAMDAHMGPRRQDDAGCADPIGAFFFKYRDLLPAPLAVGVLARARPTRTGWLLGLPCILAGELLRLWALRHIGPTTRTRDICADRLVRSGPYRVTRNPLYLANLLKVVGLLVIAGDWPVAVLAMGFYGIEFSSIIRYEEEFLARRFPEAFAAWSAAVPAFLPDGRRWEGEEPAAPHTWGEALRSEGRTFQSTGLLLGLLALVGWWRAGEGGGGEERDDA